jgi:hypothetical protein
MTVLKASVVKGTISLPYGETAPAGGLSVQISAFPGNNYTYVTIPEGCSSAPYSLKVQPQNNEYTFSYYITGKNDGYSENGYYSGGGTTSDSGMTTAVDIRKAGPVDMTILKANSIRGTISLPQGETAGDGGLKIGILAVSGGFLKSTYVTIGKGMSSASYSLTVLPGNESYRLSYYIEGDPAGYAENGYYSNGITTTDMTLQTSVDVKGITTVNMVTQKAK